MKPPIKKPQVVEPLWCACGDHAWAVLTRGFVTLVSPQDADLLRVKWHAHKSGDKFYAFRTIHLVGSGRATAKRYADYLHRRIRIVRPGVLIDHRSGDTLDNRRGNLRTATRAQNAVNSRKNSGGLSSTYKGVTWSREWGKWCAQIGKTSRFLGYFAVEEAAARAYDAAAVRLYGVYARLNFPVD